MLRCLANVTFFVTLVITLERPHSLGGGSPLYEENVAEKWWGITVMIAVILYPCQFWWVVLWFVASLAVPSPPALARAGAVMSASAALRLPCWLRGKEPACHAGDTETQVPSLGGEDPLEEEMATHSNNLAQKTPWAEDPSGLHSMGLIRVGHGWALTADSKNQRIEVRGQSHCHLGPSWLHLNFLFTASFLVSGLFNLKIYAEKLKCKC